MSTMKHDITHKTTYCPQAYGECNSLINLAHYEHHRNILFSIVLIYYWKKETGCSHCFLTKATTQIISIYP